VEDIGHGDRTAGGLGSFAVDGLVRRARRIADLSQRELAAAAGIAPSTIGRIEAGDRQPSLALLLRVLGVAGLELVVVDAQGRVVQPMADWDDTRDGAERRYPSHLDTILDPEPGEWWGDVYGLMRPPETFHRDRARRDMQRARSQWEVRVAKYRGVPPPPDPRAPRWRVS
jgi:transcriptional regulator with XRE-family HTH domain